MPQMTTARHLEPIQRGRHGPLFKRDHPRIIDRLIDYFGEGRGCRPRSEPRRAGPGPTYRIQEAGRLKLGRGDEAEQHAGELPEAGDPIQEGASSRRQL